MTNTAALALRFTLSVLAALVAHELHIEVEFSEFIDVFPEVAHLIEETDDLCQHHLVIRLTGLVERVRDAITDLFDGEGPIAFA